MPNKRDRQKWETRMRILEATKEIIAEQGLNAFTTLEIANRASIAHGSVFVHFPDKTILLIHTIERFGSSLVKRIHQSTENDHELQSVLSTHLRILQRNESFYAAVIEGRKLLPKPAQETLISIQSAVSYHLIKAAEDEVSRGALKKMPAYLLFNTWLGLIHYYLTNRDLFSPGASVLKDKGNELVSHFMNLVKP